MEFLKSEDFRSLVLNKTPLLDVRAGVEFEKGAFPNAVNLPLLNDEERRVVGIKYKEEGNDAALKLGHKLIQGALKEERLAQWKAFIKANPDAFLYCFRGGQRSGITQAWLKDAGVEITRLKGGYKAFRSFLMQESENISASLNTLIIGGRTGSGKTILLKQFKNAIDLEGLANHRGSSFGRFISAQPSQINFENALAYKFIEMKAQKSKNFIIEHESRMIGRIEIPKTIYDNFEKGQLIILETPLQVRVDITYDEYVVGALVSYKEEFEEEGAQKWAEQINGSLDRIKKRLGSERYIELKKIFKEAFDTQVESGKLEAHKAWIEILLRDYYDPMYDYQIGKSIVPIIFRGDAEAVAEFIQLQESK